jgi:hypothetical protein
MSEEIAPQFPDFHKSCPLLPRKSSSGNFRLGRKLAVERACMLMHYQYLAL